MRPRSIIILIILSVSGFLLINWYGLVISALLFLFLSKIYELSFLKKEAVYFFSSGKSVTFTRKQKLMLSVRLLCADCFNYLDDISLIKVMSSLNLERQYLTSLNQAFLQTINPKWQSIFPAFTITEIKLIFIYFGGIAEKINKQLAAEYINKITSDIPEQYRAYSRLNNEITNYSEDFKIMEVDPGAESKQIKKQYKKLAKSFHPDTFTHLTKEQKDLGHNTFIKILNSYSRLMKFYNE